MKIEAGVRRNSLKGTTLVAAYVAWVVLLRVDVGGDLTDTVVTIFVPIPLAIGMLALEDPRGRPVSWLRGVLPGLLPGLVAGSILGLALRVAMRLVALAARVPASFTMPGTLTVVLIFALLGAGYGALLTAAWRSIPGFRPAPGLIGGTGLALWWWYPLFLAGENDLSGLISAPLIILFTTLMAGAWIGYGMLLAALMRRAGSFPEPVLDDASSRTALSGDNSPASPQFPDGRDRHQHRPHDVPDHDRRLERSTESGVFASRPRWSC